MATIGIMRLLSDHMAQDEHGAFRVCCSTKDDLSPYEGGQHALRTASHHQYLEKCVQLSRKAWVPRFQIRNPNL